mmetsp:Transcript_68090/g.215488  ORF Transcript_68090/g.215488 Transcript_68090/m.215488 type:complete len:207 (-) Transcript_68090:1015-1635(-)
MQPHARGHGGFLRHRGGGGFRLLRGRQRVPTLRLRPLRQQIRCGRRRPVRARPRLHRREAGGPVPAVVHRKRRTGPQERHQRPGSGQLGGELRGQSAEARGGQAAQPRLDLADAHARGQAVLRLRRTVGAAEGPRIGPPEHRGGLVRLLLPAQQHGLVAQDGPHVSEEDLALAAQLVVPALERLQRSDHLLLQLRVQGVGDELRRS